MQSWQTVVACVAAVVVCQGVLGHPRAREESMSELSNIQEDVNQKQPQDRVWMPLEIADRDRKHVRQSEEELKKTPRSPIPIQDEEEFQKVFKSDKEEQKVGVGEFAVVDGAQPKKDDTLGSTRIELAVPEGKEESRTAGEDVARSKKSANMRDMSFHPTPTTTVCIQVRSDHLNPSQVMCGPKVGEEQREDKSTPSPARFAYQPAPGQAPFNPMYAQRDQPPMPYPSIPRQMMYVRASPQDIEPSRPPAASGQRPQQIIVPQPSPGPSMSPKAARGPSPLYPMRRNEDDNTLKPSEGTPQPIPPSQPFRIIPQSPPASVVVHKQIYQAAPLPAFTTNLVSPAPVPLRFNCALQPEGGQFIQSYGSMLRNSPPSSVLPGYIPLGGEVIIPDTSSRMSQDYYYDTQGRSAQPGDSSFEYSVDPWVGAAFVGEDGNIYRIDEAQGRSAGDDDMNQWDSQYLSAPPTPGSGMSAEEMRANYQQQQEQLKQSNERLERLQKQLKELEQRTMTEEDAKKPLLETPKESKSSGREPTVDAVDEPKKPEPSKANKRHSIRHSMIQ